MNAPKVGELWRDKDKRELSGNRIVRVEEVTEEHVYYKSRTGLGQRHRSKLVRFVRAFSRVESEVSP